MAGIRDWLGATQPEPITDELMRRSAIARCLAAGSAIVLDVFIYFFFRNHPKIDPATLRFFAIANLSVLTFVGLASYFGQVRAQSPRLWVTYISIPLELFTIIVWIQATGTVSSYFILIGPLLFTMYRGFFSHRFGVVALGSLVALHLGAFALEQGGILRTQSLFLEPPTGLYADPQFRITAMLSITWTYVFLFFGANIFINQLRLRERALHEAERQAKLAVEGARHGRLTGTKLDELALGELLGRGGMGEVYAGTLGDERCAVKVLHPHLVSDTLVFARFQREAEAAALVPGGYCPRVLRASFEPLPYIAMELLEGEDLAAHFRRRGQLTLEEVAELADRLAAALDAVHAVGIVHRDLTPANVFLLADHIEATGPKVKLLDLGICKLRESAPAVTQQSAILGTPGFLSPEQAQGRNADVGVRSDVFAFGAILYRALTGHLPFPAGDLLSAIEQVCTAEATPPSELRKELPPDVDDVVAWALAKSPADRYASAGQVAADLKAAVLHQLSVERRGRAVRQRQALGYATTLSPTEAASGGGSTSASERSE